MPKKNNSRREFIKRGTMAGIGTVLATNLSQSAHGKTPLDDSERVFSRQKELVLDIHQHIFYHGRTDEQLIHHQKTMGVTKTIMLPAGSPQNRRSTHYGLSNGLQVQAGANKSCYDFAEGHAASFSFAANEVPDLPDAVKQVEKYLKLGGKMIAEVKFGLACDSPGMQKLYKLAADYDVPILMHWKYQVYNLGFPRFYKMLEKHPKTKFIGHAQTFWGNIDKKQQEQPWNLYPKGPVTPGGLTDRYLSDYENMFGDLSAGSGLNAYKRDEDFTKDFFERHQDKLMFGSDCADSVGKGEACTGAQTIGLIKRITPKKVGRKLLYENAKKILKL